MARTDDAGPVVLSPVDIGQAMELSAEAGWNQLPADWRLFMTGGTVFGLFDGAVLAATAAIIPYGDEFAWIGMVLTRKDRRGSGFGTTLLKACIAELDALGRTALLDATPAGEPLYRGLGFTDGERFTRWQGIGGGGAVPADVAGSGEAAIAAANAAFGADRTALLVDFAARCPATRRSAPDGAAHCFGRDGRIATQIGPVVGDDQAAGDLVDVVVGSLDGPVFVDVADRCRALAARLEARGFTKQRPFLRMKKGPHAIPGQAGRTAVIAGPEFG